MLIRTDSEGRLAHLSAMLEEVASAPGTGLMLVLACDENGFTPDTLDPLLRQCARPLIGGIFPQIISGGERLTRGSVVIGLPCAAAVLTVRDISDPEHDFDRHIREAFTPAPAGSASLFVFADGLARRIHALIESLYNTFGLDIDYLGGGAGSLSLRPTPCILSNQGLLQDAAVLALTDMRTGIGVSHGWSPISRALKVTESDRNTIISLDWRPAFEVYREVVEAHSGLRFDAAPFFERSKAYPFGIAKLDNEMVVRDPLIRDQDRLVCVGEVPPQTHVHILHGDHASLLAAAENAAALAHAHYRGSAPARSVFVIDCISRVLFMGERFDDEMHAIACGLPRVGALTLGEIANSGRDYIEFYNKSIVVGRLDG